jgi:hypothetical protein
VDFLINVLRGLSEWALYAQYVFSIGREPVSGPLSDLKLILGGYARERSFVYGTVSKGRWWYTSSEDERHRLEF